MSSEHRPRVHRLINPEASAALLRRIVECWDSDDEKADDALITAIDEARRLLSGPTREDGEEK